MEPGQKARSTWQHQLLIGHLGTEVAVPRPRPTLSRPKRAGRRCRRNIWNQQNRRTRWKDKDISLAIYRDPSGSSVRVSVCVAIISSQWSKITSRRDKRVCAVYSRRCLCTRRSLPVASQVYRHSVAPTPPSLLRSYRWSDVGHCTASILDPTISLPRALVVSCPSLSQV